MRRDRFDWSGYFEWLVEQIDDGEHDDMLPVLSFLWKKEFRWNKCKDRGRERDAIKLREKYSDEYDLYWDEEVEEEPCTVLEIFVRLALDVENRVVAAPGEERPDIWFWEWLENLGIDSRCEGKGYDKAYLDQCIDTWLDGDITRSGRRSPFPIRNKGVDQRTKDIWMACMAYVNEKEGYW